MSSERARLTGEGSRAPAGRARMADIVNFLSAELEFAQEQLEPSLARYGLRDTMKRRPFELRDARYVRYAMSLIASYYRPTAEEVARAREERWSASRCLTHAFGALPKFEKRFRVRLYDRSVAFVEYAKSFVLIHALKRYFWGFPIHAAYVPLTPTIVHRDTQGTSTHALLTPIFREKSIPFREWLQAKVRTLPSDSAFPRAYARAAQKLAKRIALLVIQLALLLDAAREEGVGLGFSPNVWDDVSVVERPKGGADFSLTFPVTPDTAHRITTPVLAYFDTLEKVSVAVTPKGDVAERLRNKFPKIGKRVWLGPSVGGERVLLNAVTSAEDSLINIIMPALRLTYLICGPEIGAAVRSILNPTLTKSSEDNQDLAIYEVVSDDPDEYSTLVLDRMLDVAELHVARHLPARMTLVPSKPATALRPFAAKMHAFEENYTSRLAHL